jgi:3-oxoacyl-[acyl-carrier protein] reductase
MEWREFMLTLNLEGKIAVVTGATGQIGRVLARNFAACGADVAIQYATNKAMADTLTGEITAMGRRAVAVRADITREASVSEMRDVIKASLGDADIVVNNAVIQYGWTSILAQDAADFQSQFDSCVMQSVLTAKAFLPAMTAKGAGRFIGVNTECSSLCNANSGAYAAAKRGMDGLYRVLAKEVGATGVTVNQVAPGWTISDRDREAHTEFDPAYAANVPLKRRGTDQEIANAVMFLASGLASFITGVCIPVCGGAVMV